MLGKCGRGDYARRMTDMHLAFKRARDAAGGIPQLAKIVDRTPANLYSLFTRERPCPAPLVLPIEMRLGISRHELRPDIFGEAA